MLSRRNSEGALVYSSLACVQLLIERNANLGVVNLSGDNALNCAAKGGDDEIVEFLISRNVSALQLNEQKLSVLDLAKMGPNKCKIILQF